MKTSSKGEYALRALIALAKNEEELMQIKDIANEH